MIKSDIVKDTYSLAGNKMLCKKTLLYFMPVFYQTFLFFLLYAEVSLLKTVESLGGFIL